MGLNNKDIIEKFQKCIVVVQEKNLNSERLTDFLLFLFFLLILLGLPESRADAYDKSSLDIDMDEPEEQVAESIFTTYLPIVFAAEPNLIVDIWGAWATNAWLEREYDEDGNLINIGNIQRFSMYGEKYASNIEPPIHKSFDELTQEEKAIHQAQYIYLIFKNWLPMFWTDFDASQTTDRTEEEIDPNCWRAYPYDVDRDIGFYRPNILNHYTVLRLLSESELQQNSVLIHQQLLESMGEDEYNTKLEEINDLITNGYRGRVLFLNEPNTELGISSQACRTPQQAVEILIKAKEILPEAKFVGPNGIQQLDEWYLDEFLRIWFIEKGRRDIPFEAVGFHIYNHTQTVPAEFINALRAVLEKYSQFLVDKNGERIIVNIIITETGVVDLPIYCQGEEAYSRFKNMLDPSVANHPYFPLEGIGPFTHFVREPSFWTHGLAMTMLDVDGNFVVTNYGKAVIAATNNLPPDITGWCTEQNAAQNIAGMPAMDILYLKILSAQSQLNELRANPPGPDATPEATQNWKAELNTAAVATYIYRQYYDWLLEQESK